MWLRATCTVLCVYIFLHRFWVITKMREFIPITLFSFVQSLSRVQLFAAPCTAARQASPSLTNSWSLRKLMFEFEYVYAYNTIHIKKTDNQGEFSISGRVC